MDGVVVVGGIAAGAFEDYAGTARVFVEKIYSPLECVTMRSKASQQTGYVVDFTPNGNPT